MSSDDSRRQEVTEQLCDMLMLRKTVPDPYSGDWKCSVVGWESGTGNRQFVRRSGRYTLSKLRVCWMMKFVGRHYRSGMRSKNVALYSSLQSNAAVKRQRWSGLEVGLHSRTFSNHVISSGWFILSSHILLTDRALIYRMWRLCRR